MPFAFPEPVPGEAQLAQALHVGLRLMGDQTAVPGRPHVRSADTEYTFTPAQTAHPLAVPLIISVAGVTQTARMSVDHPEHRQAPVPLANHATGQGLAFAIEPHVSDTGIAFG